jgi:hypothetical protein
MGHARAPSWTYETGLARLVSNAAYVYASGVESTANVFEIRGAAHSATWGRGASDTSSFALSLSRNSRMTSRNHPSVPLLFPE